MGRSISELPVALTIDSVTTLAAGAQATVNNVGTSRQPRLRFGIPRGISGEAGSDILNVVYLTAKETSPGVFETLEEHITRTGITPVNGQVYVLQKEEQEINWTVNLDFSGCNIDDLTGKATVIRDQSGEMLGIEPTDQGMIFNTSANALIEVPVSNLEVDTSVTLDVEYSNLSHDIARQESLIVPIASLTTLGDNVTDPKPFIDLRDNTVERRIEVYLNNLLFTEISYNDYLERNLAIGEPAFNFRIVAIFKKPNVLWFILFNANTGHVIGALEETNVELATYWPGTQSSMRFRVGNVYGDVTGYGNGVDFTQKPILISYARFLSGDAYPLGVNGYTPQTPD